VAYQAKTTVVFDRSAEIVGQIIREAAELRHQTAQKILAGALSNAPEQTGGLKASGYIVDETGSGYSEAAAAAASRNAHIVLLPAVPAEPDTTIVAFAAEYAELNEYYTGPTNPGAHPFLTPATEAERSAWEAAVARLGGAAG